MLGLVSEKKGSQTPIENTYEKKASHIFKINKVALAAIAVFGVLSCIAGNVLLNFVTFGAVSGFALAILGIGVLNFVQLYVLLADDRRS